MSARQVFALALSDLVRTLRSRESLLWLLVMPLPFTFFFGIAFRSAPESPTPVVVVTPAADAGTEAVTSALAAAGYAVERVEAWKGGGEVPRRGYRLELPDRLGARLVAGKPVAVELWSRRGDPEAGRLEAVLQRVLWTARADLLIARVEGAEPDLNDLGRTRQAPPVEVTSRDWGPRREVPSGFKQSAPGNMVMFVLMAVLVSATVRLAVDRESGVLRRVLSYPVSAPTVVAAQMLGLVLPGLAEAAYLLALSILLFRVPFGGAAPAAFGVLALLVVAAAGIGALLGSLLETVRRSAAVGLLLTLGLAALGGCWWPLEVVPEGMRTVALALPTGQAMHALIRLLVWGDPPAALGGTVAYFVTFAAVSGTAATLVLRRRLA